MMDYFKEHPTWFAACGAMVAGTLMCWFGKISGAEWVAMLALFIPMLGKEALVTVKAMNQANGT